MVHAGRGIGQGHRGIEASMMEHDMKGFLFLKKMTPKAFIDLHLRFFVSRRWSRYMYRAQSMTLQTKGRAHYRAQSMTQIRALSRRWLFSGNLRPLINGGYKQKVKSVS